MALFNNSELWQPRSPAASSAPPACWRLRKPEERAEAHRQTNSKITKTNERILTSNRQRIAEWATGTAVIGGLVAIILFLFSITSVDIHELGYSFDRYEGKIEKLEKQGWVLKPCWRYAVHTIDLRPQQIQISANQRVLNAKLVRFNPEGLDTFIEWHGRGAGDEPAAMGEILKCYAFNVNNGADCPFLVVLDEMAQKAFPQEAKRATPPTPNPEAK